MQSDGVVSLADTSFILLLLTFTLIALTISSLNEGSWIISISTVTNLYLCLCVSCVCLCVHPSVSPPPACALSLVLAFCRPCAGLPVLLLLLCVLAAVHQNMALLPTGITSARSALTRSRATVWPWGTTRLSRRRKFQLPMGDGHQFMFFSKSVSHSIRRELCCLF